MPMHDTPELEAEVATARYTYGQTTGTSPTAAPPSPPNAEDCDDTPSSAEMQERRAYQGARPNDYDHINAAQDMLLMERRLMELEGRLGDVADALGKRAKGDEGKYRQILSAKEGEREAARQAQEREVERLHREDQWMRARVDLEYFCRGLVSSLVAEIDVHYQDELEARRRAEEERLDKLLRDEAEERERARRGREVLRERESARMDDMMYTSTDPVLQRIRQDLKARYEEHLLSQAQEEEDEMAALEARLARLTSNRR